MSAADSRIELYVYYRVGLSDWPAALHIVRGFQRLLRSECPGLSARVLRRPGESGGSVTLMEIYACADGLPCVIDGHLQRRIDEAAEALTPLLAGPRRVEIFEPLD